MNDQELTSKESRDCANRNQCCYVGTESRRICKREKSEKQIMYNRLRPNVSDRGARIKGPMPRKTTKPVVAPITTFGAVCKSSAI